jgi:CspA family cold shock protein
MAIRQSTVKWFDAKKGYGFIHHPDGGEDVFVHYTQIETEKDFKTLRTGQTVEFEMNDGPKGLHALGVNPTGLADEAADEIEEPTPSPPTTADPSRLQTDTSSLPRVDQREATGSSNPAGSQPAA